MKTILLVEDSKTCAAHLAARLRMAPHFAVVYEATSLHEARIWIAALGHFTLAIVDVQLPDGSGLELLPLLVGSHIVVATADPASVQAPGVIVVPKGPGWVRRIESVLAGLVPA